MLLSSVVKCLSHVTLVLYSHTTRNSRARAAELTVGCACGRGVDRGSLGQVRAPAEAGEYVLRWMGRRAEPANLDALRRRDSGVGAPVGTGGVGTSGQATRKLPKCEAQRAEDRFINAGTNECI